MRKPQSVTHIWTVNATMVDSGSGMETANLFAHGPGLLETRPIPDKMDSPLKDVPPDRTAVWQDLMMLKNLLGPDQKIVQKELVLKGYPRVVDRVQQQSIDAVDTIAVWLKPKPAESTPAKSATAKATTTATSGQEGQGDSSAEGGSFQIQRLLALRNVHLVAPSKNLTARDRLDADFKEAPARRSPRDPPPREPHNLRPRHPHPRLPRERTRGPTSRKSRRWRKSPNP